MPLSITDFTNTSGTGVFDKIMDAIDTELGTQYDANRITGAEYANVYLAAIQSAISESVNFLKLDVELALQEAQSAQDLATKQAQQDLLEQQLLTEAQNTLLMTEKVANAGKEGDILDNQITKSGYEATLMNQKYITEWAQTQLTSATGSVSGILGAQKTLYECQSAGFKHKAAQSALQALVDIWSVAATSGETVIASTDVGINGLIKSMVEKLWSQADVTSPDFTELTMSAT